MTFIQINIEEEEKEKIQKWGNIYLFHSGGNVTNGPYRIGMPSGVSCTCANF